MSQPILAQASGVIAAGTPAAAMITSNARVLTPAGPVAIVTDAPQFPGPATVGTWLVGASRVLVSGMPVVTQASTGLAIVPSPAGGATAPMTVIHGDPRVQAL